MNTLNGYSKIKLTDDYVLTAAGGHTLIKHLVPAADLSSTSTYTTSKAVKDALIELFDEYGTGIGSNVVIPAQAVTNWNDESKTLSASSVYSMIKIGGGYGSTTHGLWLLSSYNTGAIKYVGRTNNTWSNIYTIASQEWVNDKGYTTNKGTVTSVSIANGGGIGISGSPITSSGTITITLNAASSSAIGGVQLGYTASGANIPLQTSSNKGYVALTKTAVTSALGYTPSDVNVKQSESTTSSYRPLVLGYNTNSSANDNLVTEVTSKVYVNKGLYAQPSTGSLFATGQLTIGTTTSTVQTPITLYGTGNKSFIKFTSGSTVLGYLGFSALNTPAWMTNDAIDTIPLTVMTGATASKAGTSGFVPAPAANKHTAFLRGDGTWVVPTSVNKLKYNSFTNASEITWDYNIWTANGVVSDVTTMGYAAVMNVGSDLSRGWQIWNRRSDENLYWRKAKNDISGWDEYNVILDSNNWSDYITAATYSAGKGLSLSGTTFALSCTEATSNTDRPIVGTNTANEIFYTNNAKINWASGKITCGGLSSSNTINITGTSADTARLIFSRTGASTWNYINWPGNSSESCLLAFGYSNSSASSYFYMSSKGFYPTENNKRWLGLDTNRWSYIYGVIGSFSSNVTITGTLSAQGGKFYTNTNGAYWTSDRRFKTNIHNPVKSGLLQDSTGYIRKFNWKDTGVASYGYIAQELLSVIPEAVDYDENLNKYSVNYSVAHSAVIGLLVIKIKELEEEVKLLKAKFN